MDRRGEELLELDEVRARLAALCASPGGRRAAEELAPGTAPADVGARQATTDEALELVNVGVHMPAGVADIAEPLRQAERGSTLDADTLGRVLGSARAIAEICATLVAHGEEAPRLAELARAVDLVLMERLADRIDRALDGHGGVRDDASIELAQTRRALGAARGAATEALRAAAQSARQHLQEGFITERAGRPVLAVKASSRSAVPGIVHDRSATGQTVFVEPLAVVEANNRVRELEAAERIEVERVLATLSREVGDVAPSLDDALERAAHVDLSLARGLLSRAWAGCRVSVADHVSLVQARHPLLDPASAVAIDLPLRDVSTLVVSGPNAGGKTVALKTLGLLALIHQCGLRPPAAEAHLPVFDQVLVDIGDDQSIEHNLSTFSGHVRRLVDVLARAGERSLVLLDEVAAGTDPGEGAALARAVLEALAGKGVLTLVTTHHHELKAWASETPGAANAAVGFDAEQLAPTFGIRVGEPGASHALEVAERLGLDAGVLATARRIFGEERGGVEALLQEAASARAAAEDERDRAIAERDEAARVRREVEQRERELAARVDKLRQDAATERARARQDARDELTELQAELASFRAELSAARRQERERARATGRDGEAERDRRLGAAAAAAQRAGERLAAVTRPVSSGPVAVGDRVIVADLGVRGEVIAIDGTTAEIQGPSARLRLDVGRLVRDGRVASEPPPPAAPEARPAVAAVPYELDVRGERAEAAVAAVRAHVDAAAMAGLETVRIIHGRGTGALRAAVADELRRHPLVQSWVLAGPDAGGDGATIGSLIA